MNFENYYLKSASRLFCGVDKPVHVNAYTRIRFGRIEFVREYCRANWGSLRKKAA